jgi:hypothetical protein
MSSSRFHDLDRGFGGLTRVDSVFLIGFFFLVLPSTLSWFEN